MSEEKENQKEFTYRAAGVDREAAGEAKSRIFSILEKTRTPGVIPMTGHFGGVFQLKTLGFKDPLLVASADGVGTKLKVGIALNRHQECARDLVAHCINDILTLGAKPLFFLDYLAFGKLDKNVVEQVVIGLAEECQCCNIALLGGETAEMPGMYKETDYDLAGFIVGAVEKEKLLDGKNIQDGDILIGLGSAGLHTNGFSLARKVLYDQNLKALNKYEPDLSCTIGEELLKPHRNYYLILEPLLEAGLIKGLAHITGGGIAGNLIRILPEGYSAVVYKSAWSVPKVFELIQKGGHINNEEMFATFNMGIGMIAISAAENAKEILEILKGRAFWSGEIGFIERDPEKKVIIS